MSNVIKFPDSAPAPVTACEYVYEPCIEIPDRLTLELEAADELAFEAWADIRLALDLLNDVVKGENPRMPYDLVNRVSGRLDILASRLCGRSLQDLVDLASRRAGSGMAEPYDQFITRVTEELDI